MSLILSLETSGSQCSVALHSKGQLVISELETASQQASVRLTPMIEKLIKTSGVSPSELSAIAVSGGPGSYTGLRIGVSTAKGLCYGLGLPLIALNSLSVLTQSVRKDNPEGHWLCPMSDARRMEVYCQISDGDSEILPTRAVVIDELSFRDMLERHEILFFGDGSDKCRGVIRHPGAHFRTGILPTAADMGILAHERWLRQETVDLVEYEPFYLKEFHTRLMG